MKQAEQIALRMSGLIYVVNKIFTPVVWLFTVSTNGFYGFLVLILIVLRKKMWEEIRMILDVGKQKEPYCLTNRI